LLEDSPAINAGDGADYNGYSVPSTDQRGQARVGTVDMGSYEYGATLTPATEPTGQASNISFTNTDFQSTTISWSNGNGAKRVVFMKEGDAGTVTPVDQTVYVADSTFGGGDQIGETGWYAVYRGSGASVNITGLIPGTTYRVQVFEFNGGYGQEKL
jgi:hypothetical protein